MKKVFLYGILSTLLKIKLDRAKIRFMKISKITKNTQKTLLFSVATWIAFMAWKKLKFGFIYLWKSWRELNFLSKDTNLESVEIFNRKL